MDRPPVPGVLIEGHEYSGKSTLARHVTHALRRRGASVRAGHATLTPDPLVRLLLDDALAVFATAPHHGFRHPPTWRRFNSRRSAQLVLDTDLFHRQPPDPRTLLVQDRYWLAQHAFNTYFTPGQDYLSQAWTASRAATFTVQVYLTCDAATRRRRAAARDGDGAKHPLGAFLRRHLDDVAALETFTTALVKDRPDWLVLHSDRFSPQEMTDAVLARLDAATALRPARPTAGAGAGAGAGADRRSAT
ncbi:hypothetical protein ACWCQK_38910 [Streptomyces sp. NPDC002306]